MKTKAMNVINMLAFVLAMSACQSNVREPKGNAFPTDESPEALRIREEIVGIITHMPNSTETVRLINSTGTAYLAGFTEAELNTDDLMTRAEKARVYGAILFDLAYTNIYNQTETFSRLLRTYEQLTRDLGYEELARMQQQFRERFKEVQNDPEAVKALVTDMLNRTNDIIQKNGSTVDISIVFASAVIKSLNVISYLTLFSPGKDQLMEALKKQKDLIDAACLVLQKTPDNQDITRYYQALEPISRIFGSPDALTTGSVEDINRLTAFITQ